MWRMLAIGILTLGGVQQAGAQEAAAPGPSSAAPRLEPDCSFRSPSTCWTVAGRFPPRRPKPAVPKPGDIRDLPPVTVASKADSAPGSR